MNDYGYVYRIDIDNHLEKKSIFVVTKRDTIPTVLEIAYKNENVNCIPGVVSVTRLGMAIVDKTDNVWHA